MPCARGCQYVTILFIAHQGSILLMHDIRAICLHGACGGRRFKLRVSQYGWGNCNRMKAWHGGGPWYLRVIIMDE